MILKLPKIARQALAVLLVFLVLGALGLAISPIFAHVAELSSHIEQERNLLSRLSSVAATQPAATDAGKIPDREAYAGLFLQGESEGIRLASLQSRLSEIFAANGVKLRSARNLPAKERDDLHLLGVQLQFAAPVERLQAILLAIEEQKPLLLIESLQVTPLAATSEEERGNLETRVDVFGVGSARKSG